MSQVSQKLEELRNRPKGKEQIMNKTKIQDRIKLLETERDQVKASLVAYEGAIQDCQYWLKQLEEPEVKNG